MDRTAESFLVILASTLDPFVFDSDQQYYLWRVNGDLNFVMCSTGINSVG